MSQKPNKQRLQETFLPTLSPLQQEVIDRQKVRVKRRESHKDVPDVTR